MNLKRSPIMVAFAWVLFASVVFFPSVSSSEVLVSEYMKKWKGKTIPIRVKAYFGGMGDGISAANDLVRLADQKGVYCRPSTILVTAENYIAILDSYLESDKGKIILGDPRASVSGAMILALKEVFPCLKPGEKKASHHHHKGGPNTPHAH